VTRLAQAELADAGELHDGALTVGCGEAEGPQPFTAIADMKIEPTTIGVGSSFLRFNLGGVERHVSVSQIHAGDRFPDVAGSTTVTDHLKGVGPPDYQFPTGVYPRSDDSG